MVRRDEGGHLVWIMLDTMRSKVIAVTNMSVAW